MLSCPDLQGSKLTSNHEASAAALISRGLEFTTNLPEERNKEKVNKFSEKEVAKFVATIVSEIDKWNTLKKENKTVLPLDVFAAFCAKYDTEAEFNNGVFNTFKKLCESAVVLPKNFVPLWLNGNWAICVKL